MRLDKILTGSAPPDDATSSSKFLSAATRSTYSCATPAKSSPEASSTAAPWASLSWKTTQAKTKNSGGAEQVPHFFEHYKDLEPNKWVQIGHWGDAAEAKQMTVDAVARAGSGT